VRWISSRLGEVQAVAKSGEEGETMRRNTMKRAKRNRDCAEWRKALIQRVGRCEACGCSPAYRKLLGWDLHSLAVHEIARGSHRHKARDKAYAVLVVDREYHDEKLSSKSEWPESRQLAALRQSRPQDYDLAAYNALVGLGPDRITEADVDAWG
jgi:hypothetical protein